MGEREEFSVVEFVMKNTGLVEGDARLLIGTVLAAYKHRSTELERDSWHQVAQVLAETLLEVRDVAGPALTTYQWERATDCLAQFDALEGEKS